MSHKLYVPHFHFEFKGGYIYGYARSGTNLNVEPSELRLTRFKVGEIIMTFVFMLITRT